MRKHGFTLIEVLVVVAIIGLLLSLVLPALRAARARGRATVCLAQIHQLGTAAQMYASAHRGLLVDYGLAHGGSVEESTTWLNTLRKEYRNILVARCPSDLSAYWANPYPGTSQRRRVSYGVNEYLTGRIGEYESYRRLDALRRPAATILFCEMTQVGEYAVSDHVHPVNWVMNPLIEARRQIEPGLHLGRANYALADGHAEPLTFEQTFKVGERRRVGAKVVVKWKHNLYDPKVGY